MDSRSVGTPESGVRVLIADAYASRRRALRFALIASATVRVVGEAVDVDDLVVKLEARPPCVLVVSDDLFQERADRAHVQPLHVHLLALGCAVRTLLLTQSPSAEFPRPPVLDHLWGCLSYSRVEQDLLKAVLAIARGEMWFSRSELAEMLRERPEGAVVTDLERLILQVLTSREIEIVQWIMRGKTNKEIGRRLAISDMTVKTHVHNIFRKLKVSGRMRLFQKFSRRSMSSTHRRYKGEILILIVSEALPFAEVVFETMSRTPV